MAAEIGFVVDDIEPQANVDRALVALGPRSLASFLRSVTVPWFAQRASRRFENEGDEASGPWAPLTQATQAFRTAAGYGPTGPINVRTGSLRGFVTDSGGDVRTTAETASLRWPDTVPGGILGRKYRTAQKGRDSTPARPVVALSEADAKVVADSFGAWVSSAAGLEVI